MSLSHGLMTVVLTGQMTILPKILTQLCYALLRFAPRTLAFGTRLRAWHVTSATRRAFRPISQATNLLTRAKQRPAASHY